MKNQQDDLTENIQRRYAWAKWQWYGQEWRRLPIIDRSERNLLPNITDVTAGPKSGISVYAQQQNKEEYSPGQHSFWTATSHSSSRIQSVRHCARRGLALRQQTCHWPGHRTTWARTQVPGSSVWVGRPESNVGPTLAEDSMATTQCENNVLFNASTFCTQKPVQFRDFNVRLLWPMVQDYTARPEIKELLPERSDQYGSQPITPQRLLSMFGAMHS